MKLSPSLIPSFPQSLMLSLAAISWTIIGCSNPFAPAIELPDRSPSRRVEQTAPDSTLVNFETSYRQKDLDLYVETLDDHFLFSYVDTLGNSHSFGLYGPGGDRAMTEEMFSTYSYIYFEYFTFSARYTETPESGFESDGAWEVRQLNFSLVVQFPNGEIKIARGFAYFKFRRQTDGTWRIIRWIDNSMQA